MVEWINYISFNGDFRAIEKELGVVIPRDLEEIVSKYNKGMPKPNVFPLENGKKVEFDSLISFNKEGSFNVFNSINECMKKRNLLPFATTCNGSFICLKPEGVFLYNLEHDVEKKVAASLTAFLNKME